MKKSPSLFRTGNIEQLSVQLYMVKGTDGQQTYCEHTTNMFWN